jgi:hypothetical protein
MRSWALVMLVLVGCDGGDGNRNGVAKDFAVADINVNGDANAGADSSVDASSVDAEDQDAAASCLPSQTLCNNICTDLSSDNQNCNGCGNVCPSGTACIGYKCHSCTPRTCATIGATCGSISDGCGHMLSCGTCSPTAVCSSNNCVCALTCGSSCVDKQSDPANCGGCGNFCRTGNCSGGTCAAPLECKPSSAAAFKVLFYGPNGTAEQPFLPGSPAPVVTVWDDPTWRSKTTTDFKAFDLIVVGESAGGCPATGSQYAALFDSASQWAPAVGRVVVSELDAAKLALAGNGGARGFLKTTLTWLTIGPGTGLYVGPDCGTRHLDFMSQFSAAFHSLAGTNDQVLVVDAAHPTMVGSAGATLSNWSSSAVGFVDGVAPNWEVVAEVNTAPSPFPVVVARNLVCPCAGPQLPTEVLGLTTGCAGTVSFANRSMLCGAGTHVCSAAEWLSLRGGAVPTHDYWTNDVLNFAGSTSSSCQVSTSTGVPYNTSCSATPMRVCGASPDPEGNTCTWLHCGYEATTPDEYFGGCTNDNSAGALCCQ